MYIWSAVDFEPIRVVENAHSGAIYSLLEMQTTLNDQVLFEVWSGSSDRAIRTWDAESFHCLKDLRAHDSGIFTMAHVGHNRIWSACEKAIHVWDQEKMTAHNLRIVPYENGDKYVGEVSMYDGVLVRSGQGELHASNGDRYVGYWKKDKRSGYGVLMYRTMDKYYGFWKRGEQHGWGVFVYADGTVFEGLHHKGQRKGLGTLTQPNGDSIRGEWNGTEVVKARFVKGDVATAARCSVQLYESSLESARIAAEHASAKRRKGPSVINANKWSGFERLAIPALKRHLVTRYPANVQNINVLSIVLSDTNHPLGKMLADFVFQFNASYHFSYGNVARLLANATDDVHSFVIQLHDVCAKVFTLPRKTNAHATIKEIVIGKVFPTVMELFRCVHKNKNAMVVVKTESLRGITVKEIGIKQEFWLLNASELKQEKQQQLTTTRSRASTGAVRGRDDVIARHQPYERAVVQLRELGRYRTIQRKLQCLISVSRCILSAVDAFYSQLEGSAGASGDMVLGTEDKFPILSYVLIKANIPHVFSEMAFIRTFADSKQLRDEADYRLTELELALEYVTTLDWNVVDEDGTLVPLKFIERRVGSALSAGAHHFETAVGYPPRRLWLAHLLMICGSQRTDFPTEFTLSAEDFEFAGLFLTDSDRDAYMTYGNNVCETVGLALERYSESALSDLAVAESGGGSAENTETALTDTDEHVLDEHQRGTTSDHEDDDTEKNKELVSVDTCEKDVSNAPMTPTDTANEVLSGVGEAAESSEESEESRSAAVQDSESAIVESSAIVDNTNDESSSASSTRVATSGVLPFADDRTEDRSVDGVGGASSSSDEGGDEEEHVEVGSSSTQEPSTTTTTNTTTTTTTTTAATTTTTTTASQNESTNNDDDDSNDGHEMDDLESSNSEADEEDDDDDVAHSENGSSSYVSTSLDADASGAPIEGQSEAELKKKKKHRPSWKGFKKRAKRGAQAAAHMAEVISAKSTAVRERHSERKKEEAVAVNVLAPTSGKRLSKMLPKTLRGSRKRIQSQEIAMDFEAYSAPVPADTHSDSDEDNNAKDSLSAGPDPPPKSDAEVNMMQRLQNSDYTVAKRPVREEPSVELHLTQEAKEEIAELRAKIRALVAELKFEECIELKARITAIQNEAQKTTAQAEEHSEKSDEDKQDAEPVTSATSSTKVEPNAPKTPEKSTVVVNEDVGSSLLLRVRFVHRFPLYVYQNVANTLQQEVE